MQTNRGDSLKKFFYDYVRIAEKIVHAERNDQLFGFVFSIFSLFVLTNASEGKTRWSTRRAGSLIV